MYHNVSVCSYGVLWGRGEPVGVGYSRLESESKFHNIFNHAVFLCIFSYFGESVKYQPMISVASALATLRIWIMIGA